MENIENIRRDAITEIKENIRRDAITEIKEKVKKNPGYLHPCNKERQKDMNKFEFSNGYEFTCWMQQNGIMKNLTEMNREYRKKVYENAKCKTEKEYRDKCAQKVGFKDWAGRKREWRHETGRNLPMEFNEECSSWFGDFVERIVAQAFPDAVRMPYGTHGYDFKCRNGQKINTKGACLQYIGGIYQVWKFDIKCNNIADYFILVAFDNRDDRNILYVWIFHKDETIRKRKFCEFLCFSITNIPRGLEELEKHIFSKKIDEIKKLCNNERSGLKIIEEE